MFADTACEEMGIEGSSTSRLSTYAVEASKHKRSKSFPDMRDIRENKMAHSAEASHRLKVDITHLNSTTNGKMKQSSNAQVQNSLSGEIVQLEQRLQNQIAVRCGLEKALGHKSSFNNDNNISMPKPVTELIREISVLEVEVTHLEQYLLSLYRKAFDQIISSAQSIKQLEVSRKAGPDEEKTVLSGVDRCQSSPCQRRAPAKRNSPPAEESLSKGVRACQSQPLSMLEFASNTSSNVISLAEHLGTRISDHIHDTPNKISEDMIKCMTAIYCKLSDPPLTNNSLLSPSSSLSSFSPKDPHNMWSPGLQNDSSFDIRLDNPFHIEGLKEFSGPYSTMVEINCIYRDSRKMSDTEIEHLLQDFRSLVSRLEEIDPRKMTHEEKLAFWINVHNALLMHTYLAYGIPQNSVKRVNLLLKAAYNVGGRIINADSIQNSILGCRMSWPGQWIRLLLSSRTKFKACEDQKTYAIERSEPLLHFALCSGNHSDPAVRVYTPKRVLQELETAKEEYIRATFGVRKDKKIVLPKVVESFSKDSGLCPAGVMEMIQRSVPDSLRKSVKKCQQVGKSRKNIEWVPHNSAFRYLVLKELMK